MRCISFDVCVPELILLDLGLPDGDGMSLMTRLRQQLKGIPVIILTHENAA